MITRKIIKYIYATMLLIVSSASMYGQTQKAYIKAADEAFDAKNYYGAITWYTEALEFDEDDVDLIYKLAESAREFEAYDIAAMNYRLLVDSLAQDSFPDAVFHLGEMFQRQGKYEDAKQYFNMYLSEYSDDNEEMTESANRGLESVEYAIEKLEDIDKSAELTQLDALVNTPYSEFGAYKKGDELYYTTMRYAEKDPLELPARSISKIHRATEDLDAAIEGSLNDTDKLVAHTTFTSDGNTMYYTLCEYVTGEEVRCDLYSRMLNDDGSFGEGTKLPAPINIDSTTNTQPQISFDSLLQKDVMYFVSDRDGGQGGLDIYTTIINDNGSFTEPVNLTAINTESNEATPFMHVKSNTLYFSTEGRKSLGGYDVYSSMKNGEEFESIVHLRSPINSSYHDLYYMLDEFGDEAYFSSNREGASYVDEALKACCFDIYNVKYDEVILELDALVFDDFTKELLDGATVTLIDSETGEVIEALTNEDGNDFYFKLKRDRNYKLKVERPFYNSETIDISTVGITESTKITKEIYLTTDRMQLAVETFNKRTKEELAGVQIVLKNLTTGTVDTIAINENGNDFYFYPKLGYKYELQASKFGFVTETEIVDLTEITEPGKIERKMYLEVFDIEDYMPVVVYFENDQPNPKSKSVNTDAIYGNLFSDYMSEKSVYMKNYTKKLSGQDLINGKGEVDEFFEGDVVGGYDKLKRFMRALKKELQLGRSLDIAIKGYTSPLADTRYNLALGQRRVSSVENEILSYENGFFRDYVASGKLIITDISFGEETAPETVDDTPVNKSKSVYSVDASRERRVHIVKITDQ